MKKLFITLALAATTFVGANAQFIIGGTIGVGSNVATTFYDGDKQFDNTDFGFGIGVKVGYGITEKMEIALKAGINYSWWQNAATVLGTTTTTSADGLGWYITPNFRYAFLDTDKFQLGVQADLNFFGDNGATLGVNSFGFGINAKPFVAWKITDHLSLDAELNVVGLGFNYITNTEETVPGANDKGKLGVFNIGENINSNAAVATMNLVELGIAYKF